MADQHYTVEQLLELAHKFKALRIKCGPHEVELSPTAFEAKSQISQESDLGEFAKVPTREELQFMSGLEWVPEPSPEDEA